MDRDGLNSSHGEGLAGRNTPATDLGVLGAESSPGTWPCELKAVFGADPGYSIAKRAGGGRWGVTGDHLHIHTWILLLVFPPDIRFRIKKTNPDKFLDIVYPAAEWHGVNQNSPRESLWIKEEVVLICSKNRATL